MAFALSAALTPLMRRVAIRTGQVANPREDRWHTNPTALMGGVAILAAFSMTQAVAFFLLPAGAGLSKFLPLFSCALLVFLLGLVDDIYGISPQNKLVGQIVAASILVFFGFKINWFTSYTLNTFVSILWIVAITNAFNLLDNMDGLAAGIAFVAAFFLSSIILVNQGVLLGNGQLLILVAFMGVLAGFLVYNFYPASIFMGDSGSLFIGFMLAGTTAHHQLFHSAQLLPIIMVPLLIVFIPIWDTGFVSIMRTLFGRSIAQGGRDHASHRMVAIGLPEGKAVLTLYCFSLIGGSIALVGSMYGTSTFFACLFMFVLVSLFFWVFLAKVRVYPEEEKNLVDKSRVLTTMWIDFTYKRRMFEVILDLFLVSFAYWVSYFLRYEGGYYGLKFPLFLKSLPIVLACLMITYFAFGVYKGVWRYTSVSEVIIYLKAVTVGVVTSLLVNVFLYRFEGFSRTVFVIFWGICLFFLAASRLSFRLIAELVRRNSVTGGSRALIYGAGDKGEFALREIVNNPKLGLTPVGFIDDDAKKHKRNIQGYKVLGGQDKLVEFIPKHDISEVIVASGGIRPENLRATCTVCARLGVTVRNLELSIKRMASNELGETENKGGSGDKKQSL